MSKKKNKRRNYRNATATTAPSAARAPRVARKPVEESETALHRLGYTAAGAAGSALLGSFLKAEDWAPKTIATVLGAVGAGLAWKGEDATIRSLGAGVMSAAGGQLALQMLTDHHDKKDADQKEAEKKAAAKKAAEGNSDDNAKKDGVTPSEKTASRNAAGLPDGALQSAFERARLRYALGHGEMPAVDVTA